MNIKSKLDSLCKITYSLSNSLYDECIVEYAESIRVSFLYFHDGRTCTYRLGNMSDNLPWVRLPRRIGKAIIFRGDKKAFEIALSILQFAEDEQHKREMGED